MNRIHRIHGFSLIEVLVTVLILAVGLLGLAGMQVTGLRSTNNASAYTQAALALNDIIERMRANPGANILVADSAADIDCANMPNPYCSDYHDGANKVGAEICTSAEMATFELNTWFCGENIGGGQRAGGVAQLFQQASITIGEPPDPLTDPPTIACSNGNPCSVRLTWEELNPDRVDTDGDGEPDATVERTFSLTVVP